MGDRSPHATRHPVTSDRATPTRAAIAASVSTPSAKDSASAQSGLVMQHGNQIPLTAQDAVNDAKNRLGYKRDCNRDMPGWPPVKHPIRTVTIQQDKDPPQEQHTERGVPSQKDGPTPVHPRLHTPPSPPAA